MDKTRLYHALATVFGGLILAQGAVRLAASFSLLAALFAVVGLLMAFVSGLALVRPDLDDTGEPANWVIASLAVGVLIVFGVTAVEFL